MKNKLNYSDIVIFPYTVFNPVPNNINTDLSNECDNEILRKKYCVCDMIGNDTDNNNKNNNDNNDNNNDNNDNNNDNNDNNNHKNNSINDNNCGDDNNDSNNNDSNSNDNNFNKFKYFKTYAIHWWQKSWQKK